MEIDIQNEIRLEVSAVRKHVKLFRNNVGLGFVGTIVKRAVTLILSNYRPIKFGLFIGSSDLIGYSVIKITPEMVGKNVAVFTSLEVKQPKKKPTDEQLNWLETVKSSGGIAGRVDSVKSALEVLDGPVGICCDK